MKLFGKGLLLVAVVFFLYSCTGSGTSSDDSTSEEFNMGGTLNGNDVKINLSVASSGVSRSEADVSGYIVYEGMTIYGTGSVDSSTGCFTLGASGEDNGISYIFTLSGTISDGKISDVIITLTIVSGESVSSFEADMAKITESVEKTSKECTVSESGTYDFEGVWTLQYRDSEEEGDIYYLCDVNIVIIISCDQLVFVVTENPVDSAYDQYYRIYTMVSDIIRVDGVSTGEYVAVMKNITPFYPCEDDNEAEPDWVEYGIYPFKMLLADITSSTSGTEGWYLNK